MKKKIGMIAVGVAIVDLFIYILLIVTGSAFKVPALTGFVFVMWFVCLVTIAFCLSGEFIRFIGKQFSAGFNSNAPTAYCLKCGRGIDQSTAFCPHCGAKR